MSPRQLLLALAALFFVAGAVLGLRSHSVEKDFDGSLDCGSILKPVKDPGRFDDAISGSNLSADCQDKLSGSKPYMLGAFGLAGIALIVGLAAPSDRPKNADGSEKPTFWR